MPIQTFSDGGRRLRRRCLPIDGRRRSHPRLPARAPAHRGRLHRDGRRRRHRAARGRAQEPGGASPASSTATRRSATWPSAAPGRRCARRSRASTPPCSRTAKPAAARRTVSAGCCRPAPLGGIGRRRGGVERRRRRVARAARALRGGGAARGGGRAAVDRALLLRDLQRTLSDPSRRRRRTRAPPPVSVHEDENGEVFVRGVVEYLSRSRGDAPVARAPPAILRPTEQRALVTIAACSSTSSIGCATTATPTTTPSPSAAAAAAGDARAAVEADLAGSERVSGQRARAASPTAKRWRASTRASALATCIGALTQRSRRRAVRDSVLTRLQTSLGGNSRTLPPAAISPAAAAIDGRSRRCASPTAPSRWRSRRRPTLQMRPTPRAATPAQPHSEATGRGGLSWRAGAAPRVDPLSPTSPSAKPLSAEDTEGMSPRHCDSSTPCRRRMRADGWWPLTRRWPPNEGAPEAARRLQKALAG